MMKLLSDNKQQGYRHTYCFNASNGRTESSRELFAPEVEAIITELETKFKKDDSADRMRKKIISQARQMHWETRESGQLKCDMARLNNWCVKLGMYHKELNAHTYEELVNLVTQFNNVYVHFLNSI